MTQNPQQPIFEITCMPDEPEFQETCNRQLNNLLYAIKEAGKLYKQDLINRWIERCEEQIAPLRQQHEEGVWSYKMFCKKCVSIWIEEAYALQELYGQH